MREAVAAGVPFLEMGDVEGEGEREGAREGEGEGTGTGGWGTPGWSGIGSWSGSRDGVETEWERDPWASGDGYVAVPEGGHIRDSRSAEEQGTNEGTWRPAVDRRGAGLYETALESGWRPGYLRRRVILSFAAVFVVLLAIIEVLAGVDKARGGLGDGSVSILWGYIPTIRELLRTHSPFIYHLVLTTDTSPRNHRHALGEARVPSKALRPLDPPRSGPEPPRRRATPRLRERLAADCALYFDTEEALSCPRTDAHVVDARCRDRVFHGRVCEG